MEILAGNRVSLLGCCSAVLCQALQQYTGVFSTEYCTFLQQYCVIWKGQSFTVLTNHRGMCQTSKRYTCTVCDVSHYTCTL